MTFNLFPLYVTIGGKQTYKDQVDIETVVRLYQLVEETNELPYD